MNLGSRGAIGNTTSDARHSVFEVRKNAKAALHRTALLSTVSPQIGDTGLFSRALP